jgi:hypothetical protein
MHDNRWLFFVGVGLLTALILGAAAYGYFSGLWDIYQ